MSFENRPPLMTVDKVRASRDGHTYHETWAARVALELLSPSSTLRAIAIEGFSVDDEPSLSDAAIEIADLVRYRGTTSIGTASSVEVLQFKYSVAREDVEMRGFDIKKTLQKFAQTDADFIEQVGTDRVDSVVRYEIVTNRPFSPALIAAVEGLSQGLSLQGDAADQAKYINEALPEIADRLPNLLKRIALHGTQGTLAEAQAMVRRTLADWSTPHDPLTRMRLANLRDLVREKAGTKGKNNNLINRVDMLACLEVGDEHDLFPAPDALPKVTKIIERPVVDELITKLKQGGDPLLVDAPGGMGKTVLIQSIARRLSSTNAVVLFDCYGGGSWRDPADGRHLPEKALPHIANLLAVRGLCDILIPGPPGPDLVRAFRHRLEQAVKSLRHVARDASVVLLLDAIEHAALQAKATRSDSFAHVVLTSLSITPIEGVLVIASCRTERRELARGDATCRRFEVPPLSEAEASELARAHQADVTVEEIADLRERSGNNPRVFVALLTAGRPYYAHKLTSGDPRDTLLDSLIWDRITKAIAEAEGRGSTRLELDAMLAGLAMLPPPVPIAELAAAQDLLEASITSFASDLHPLITQSSRGLIFADEPTETLIQRKIENDSAAREAVVQRLKARQEESTYAARALPPVLTSLGRTDDLIHLAFDDRLPHSASSRVAQRAIRSSRLVAALTACAQEQRPDDLVRLLLEASRVAGGHERSDQFLQDYPDLVAISEDPEALRRLFETRASWPGKRHAAMALAYMLTDDLHEARRNASRAFDWLNWHAGQPEERGPRTLAEVGDLDRFGPAYWALLSRQPSRVVRWINQWREDYAFSILAQIASLLERHAAISKNAKLARERLYRLACRCRLMSRPLFAALLHHNTLGSSESRQIITLLARASSNSGPPSQTWRSYEDRRFGFVDALLSAATKAARLGMDSEARSILDSIGLRRPRLAEFESEVWVSETIQPFLLAECIRAAIEHRSPTLMDLCPEEIDSQIQKPTSRKTPQSFEKAIDSLLKQRKVVRKKRRAAKDNEKKFDNRQREEALRVLTHRVRPLINHASAITKIISAASANAEIESAIDLLTRDVAVTESYPYRSRSRYIANICFPLLFKTTDALEVLSGTTATTLSTWLENSPVAQHNNLTYVISRMARSDATRDAALALAHVTGNKIAAETDTSYRINAFGSLARAIWLASQSEAQAYFRRGLEFADAMGSDDYDKVAELNAFAAQYAGPILSPAITHSFARVCELNIPEEGEKFAWSAFGQAMSRICGAGTLAIVARLADRGKADLSYALPPLLTALAKDHRLATDLAAALIGLDEPAEIWTWLFGHFLEAVLPNTPHDRRETIVDFVLCEIDRQYRGYPLRESLERIAAVADQYLPEEALCRQRIAEMLVPADANSIPLPSAAKASPLNDSDTPFPGAALAGINTGDPADIDSALENKSLNDTNKRSPVHLLRALGEGIRGVDDRRRFLEAVCEARIPSLSDKLMALADLVSVWRAQSAAISDILPSLAKRLATRHVSELVGSEWDASYGFRSLVEFSGQSGQELIPIIILALRERAQFVGNIAWLRFATVMAKVATPGAIQAALDHFLTKFAETLPQDFGDGAWQTKLTVPSSDQEIVAGLLWFRLGSPIAAERWRAAHAIRRLLQLGRSDVLKLLVARLDSVDAGPFQDQTLPFFHLHARLWLLITLSRIAIDLPDQVLPFITALENAAFDPDSPHVLIRHFAGFALNRIAPLLPASAQQDLLSRLKNLNISPFPRAKLTGNYTGTHGARPAENPKSPKPFHFDYDFVKYELDDVAHLFGVPQWKIEDTSTAWIRKWSADADNMYSSPRGHLSYDDRIGSWSSASQPSEDTWGGYLAWHALMFAAGELLQTTPILGFFHEDDPWNDWLAEHLTSGPEGLWLADGTDPFPHDIKRPFKSTETDADGVPTDPITLRTIAGLTADSSLGNNLVVDGFWRGVDGIDFSVRSAIVSSSEAMNVGLAVALERPFHRYLPRDNDWSWNRAPSTAQLFQPWITGAPDRSARLDRHDPYCSLHALDRSRPSDDVIRTSNLEPEGPFKCKWSLNGTTIFSGQAWGSRLGRNEHETENGGIRLFCQSDFLVSLLAKRNSQLVLLVRAQKYLEKRKEERADPFRTETLIAIIDSNSVAKFVRRIPRRVRMQIETLSENDRHDFHSRLAAIRQALGKPMR